jgi:hypothetical protein
MPDVSDAAYAVLTGMRRLRAWLYVSPSTVTFDVRFEELLALFELELDAVAVEGPVVTFPMDALPPVADAPAVAPARAAASARAPARALFQFRLLLLLLLLFAFSLRLELEFWLLFVFVF